MVLGSISVLTSYTYLIIYSVKFVSDNRMKIMSVIDVHV